MSDCVLHKECLTRCEGHRDALEHRIESRIAETKAELKDADKALVIWLQRLDDRFDGIKTLIIGLIVEIFIGIIGVIVSLYTIFQGGIT